MRRSDLIFVVIAISVIGVGAFYYVKPAHSDGSESPPAPAQVDATALALRAISACRLVGVWQPQPRESFDGLLDDVRGARPEHDPLKPEPPSKRPTPRAEVFLPDGTWKTAKVGGDKTWNSQWSVVEDRDDKVTIEMDDPEASGKRMRRDFVFESPDLMHEVGGVLDGMKYKRADSTAKPPR